ncbi:GyrI-like domain-containing protein [Bernardetia sp. Wsw4-3y2]|uniref:GyrI-like domain-containing protein n=1 Tax=unclassified Bernardetia TaxID=2647129 RepID=UPI0030D1EBCC
MNPEIKILPSKKLIGNSLKMSLSNNKTMELWQSFMPQKKTIKHTIGTDLYSIQIYNESLDFKDFNPKTEFTKCAMIEVDSFEVIPQGMEKRVLEGGLYAVFLYKGLPKDFPKMAQYIFEKWLPNSDYQLDKREHFEILGEKYNPTDESSEEEIWIPIKLK